MKGMVYVVLCNDRVSAVFSNREAAEHHAHNLVRSWNITQVLELPLLEI